VRITRRQFIKVLSATAAAMGLGQAEIEKMAEVLAKPSTLGTLPVLWIQNQVCGGCITAFAGVFAGEVDYTDLNGDNFYDTTGLVQAKALNAPGYTAGSNASSSTVDDVLLDVIDLKFMNVIMGPAGELAASILKYYRDTATAGSFVVILDGTIPSDDEYCGLGYIASPEDEISSPSDVSAIAQKAALVIAYGTCASFGGIPSGMNRKYDAANGRYEGGTTTSQAFAGPVPESWAQNSNNLLGKVIRIPVCPGHPEALLLTVVDALETLGSAYGGRLPSGSPYKPTLTELVENFDSQGRPKKALVLSKILGTSVWLYGQPIHNSCPRLSKYAAGVYDRYFGDTRQGCLEKLGCQGPSVYTPCVSLGWNREISGTSLTTCVAQGAPCVGCGAPGFPDTTLGLNYK